MQKREYIYEENGKRKDNYAKPYYNTYLILFFIAETAQF